MRSTAYFISFNLAREKLFPDKTPDDFSSSSAAAWKRPPTIFGPLYVTSQHNTNYSIDFL